MDSIRLYKVIICSFSILSDREIRTMATRLYDLPLDLQVGIILKVINSAAIL